MVVVSKKKLDAVSQKFLFWTRFHRWSRCHEPPRGAAGAWASFHTDHTLCRRSAPQFREEKQEEDEEEESYFVYHPCCNLSAHDQHAN